MDKTLEDECEDLPEQTYGPYYNYWTEAQFVAAKRRAVEMAIRRAAEVCRKTGREMSPSKAAASDECAGAILKLLD
jgi:hypothetical protein